ncbi:MAG: ribonuclease HI family protein [Actinomycetota bacterium]|nr:ribonuclease HI family protein [Actinomycetota bacterium]
MRARLHTDGGARGNPGPAGIGVVLADDAGKVIADIARGIGSTTNNIAEYEALISGLELALEHGITDIEVFVDSELVAHQVRGEWKIKKEHLRGPAVRARNIMGRFKSASIKQVRRELNADADNLANQGMDQSELDLDMDRERDTPSLFE